MSAARIAWHRLADPRLVSWVTFLITGAIFLVDPLLQIRPNTRFEVTVIVSVFVAQIVTFMLLGVARLLYLRTAFARRHPLVMLLTIAFVTFLSVIFGVFVQLALATTVGNVELALDTVLFRIGVIALVGIAVVSWRTYRESMSELLELQQRLTRAKEEGEQRYGAERQRIVDRVTAMLEEALGALRADRPSIAEGVLRSTAQDIVRPLSHELATSTPHFAAPHVEVHDSREQILRQVTSAPLISPLFMAASVTFLAVRQTVATPGDQQSENSGPGVTVDLPSLLQAFGLLAAIFITVWIAAFVVARITASRIRSLDETGRVVTIAVGLVVVILAVGLVLGSYQLIIGRGFSGAVLGLIAAIPILFVAGIMAFVRVISALWSANIAAAESVNDELIWEVTKIRESLWQQQRALARALHGPLKNAIHAGSMQLTAHQGAVPPDVIDSIRDGIRNALGEVARISEGPVDLGEHITMLQRTWLGVCDVQIDIDQGIADRLVADPSAAVTAIDIVSEAVANAAIHGSAPHAWVAVHPQGTRSIEITVRDDGSPGAQVAEPGLGSATLDEVCLDWELDVQPTGSRLRAVLALR